MDGWMDGFGHKILDDQNPGCPGGGYVTAKKTLLWLSEGSKKQTYLKGTNTFSWNLMSAGVKEKSPFWIALRQRNLHTITPCRWPQRQAFMHSDYSTTGKVLLHHVCSHLLCSHTSHTSTSFCLSQPYPHPFLPPFMKQLLSLLTSFIWC